MKKQARQPQNPQSGNVFFIILVMIALFAALSYAMTQSSRTGSAGLGKETARLAASEIITYANQMTQAVKTLTINGCSVAQLSFANPVLTGVYNNATSPTNKTCHVFEPAGGGLRILRFSEKFFSKLATFPSYYYPIFHGRAQVAGVGTECANATCNELIMAVVDIKPDVCFAINKQLGINVDTISEQVADWYYVNSNLYAGVFDNASTLLNSIGNESGNVLRGKKMGCLKRHDLPPNTYEFYAVLAVR